MVALSLGALTAGCYPMLVHDTRVHEGTSLAIQAGLQTSYRDSIPARDRPTFKIVPAMSAQVAIGMRSAHDESSAVRVAVGVNVLAPAGLFDLYLETPRAFLGETDAGAGIGVQLGEFDAFLPYVQIGRRVGHTEASWLTHQAVGFIKTANGVGWNLVWLPTLAFGPVDRGHVGHFFVTGVVGRRSFDCPRSYCEGGSRSQRTYLMIGFAMERLFGTRPGS